MQTQRRTSRFAQLCRIAKVLGKFDGSAGAITSALEEAGNALQLRSAVLVQTRSELSRGVVWMPKKATPSEVLTAEAGAWTAFADLLAQVPPSKGPTAATSATTSGGHEPDLPTLPPFTPMSINARLPLTLSGQRPLGLLVLESITALTEDDFAFANVVAYQLAMALDRFEQSRHPPDPKAGETREAAQARLRFLLEASAVLSDCLDHRTALEQVARLAVPMMGDGCVFSLIHDDEVIFQATGGELLQVGTEVTEAAERLSMRSFAEDRPYSFPPMKDALAQQLLPDDPEVEKLKSSGFHSILLVPLRAHGQLWGTAAFLSRDPSRTHGPSDLSDATDLSHRIAVAISNSAAYHSARSAIRTGQDLIATVSHDLKNPLEAIVLSAGLLLATAPEGDRRKHGRKQLDRIVYSTRQMKDLVGDLMDVSLIEAGGLRIQRSPCSVSSLLTEVYEVLQPLAARRSLTFTCDMFDEELQISADRRRILQVLSNLVGNAIKYTKAGGTVKVTGRIVNDELQFQVADTGIGIKADDLPHVFERYWQVRATGRSGSGLGLAVAKGIVDAHGGRIWVESALGVGSTFHFTIPKGPDERPMKREMEPTRVQMSPSP